MPKKINTLEGLRQEKELLKLKMKLTRQALVGSLNQNRLQAQRLIINKIALPIGAGALASWVIQYLAKKTKDDVEIMGEPLTEEENAPSLWWIPIARTLMRFLESYIDQIDSVETFSSDNGHSTHPVAKSKEV